MNEEYDLAIIGGGINGCGIARDAAGRGLSVLLVEQFDLAGATSSASSKLIHGGLRYLEHYAFRLVRESLHEREILLKIAPHIVSPLRFIFPHISRMRSPWMIRLGLLIYDHLARSGTSCSLPSSHKLPLKGTPLGIPLRGMAPVTGFEYYDCWTNDARLVVLNARDAALKGARILTRTQCISATVKDGQWHLRLSTKQGHNEVRARSLVNATGPWAETFLRQITDVPAMPENPRPSLRLVQGSHIVVPALYEGDHAYLLQNDDDRVVFALPYEKKFTLIGTTDCDFHGNPEEATVSDSEVEYLQDVIKRYFGSVPDKVIHRFCGVRPLVADSSTTAQKTNRDYLLKLEHIQKAPLLSIYGGKLTTYRKLAEKAMDQLAAANLFPSIKPAWSATAPLPGGELPENGMAGLIDELTAFDPRITPACAHRLAHTYGSLATSVLPATADREEWQCFGDDLYAWEVDYLIRNEWALEVDDILWRRSVLGIHFSSQQRERLAAYIGEKTADA